MSTPPVRVADDIADVIRLDGPVVVLESTIITHGMPYPRNVETALAVEDEIRSGGAVPATVAVVDGVLRVGVAPDEIERLASASDVRKVSRRDLAYALCGGGLGGTTVAATMIAARLAGVSLFATGGIGGVHRGAEHTFDISADMQELARTPVTVVSAGFKAILDLPRTLEYLETHGVPVVGYRTDTLPAFYTRGRLELDQRAETAEDVADLIRMRRLLGLDGGMVVANPIPEADAMDEDLIDEVIARAVTDAEARGIHGKETTPFLLDRVSELTGDRSLEANIALVRNNARLAAAIAVALAG